MILPSEDAGVGQSTYETLRTDIIFGRLAPASKLKLDDLRDTYGASVSTIREALNRLTTEELVLAEGQRGFFVAPMTAKDLVEIADLRILLECHALTLSFANGDTEWEGRIVSAHHKLHRMEQRMAANDVSVRESWKQYDWEFHQALISACDSASLLSLHGSVFDKYLRYQMRSLTFRGDKAAREHREMLDAAMDRDSERAKTILRSHIEGGVRHCLNNPNVLPSR
ncbi:GntR family transcriptional regulator [Marivivens sp. LCG002]|uniref:GntR family transcriptional regulator n=1 Tax=Marivivens sp. LCG002 TaxID=3051171 RepID=UPI0025521174|nr:GntR family transcriptional regulator [Marivivens sp. LCG002]WIV49593.1 GntR family transcriptional regulator [Marivivens sp. LCG002]